MKWGQCIVVDGEGRGTCGAGVSPAVFCADIERETRRRDAGATKII
jgi:hypothetical protein